MFLLVFLSAAAVQQPQPVQSRTTVRIVAAARASSAEWQLAPAERRKKIELRDDHGRKVTVRVVDHE